jgi:hypothetical protein
MKPGMDPPGFVRRPYLDKLSNRMHLPQTAQASLHLLPSLGHTGVYLSQAPKSPRIQLMDGSLNKAYVGGMGATTFRQINRDAIAIDAYDNKYAYEFTRRCTKRINKKLKKLQETKRIADEKLAVAFNSTKKEILGDKFNSILSENAKNSNNNLNKSRKSFNKMNIVTTNGDDDYENGYFEEDNVVKVSARSAFSSRPHTPLRAESSIVSSVSQSNSPIATRKSSPKISDRTDQENFLEDLEKVDLTRLHLSDIVQISNPVSPF